MRFKHWAQPGKNGAQESGQKWGPGTKEESGEEEGQGGALADRKPKAQAHQACRAAEVHPPETDSLSPA